MSRICSLKLSGNVWDAGDHPGSLLDPTTAPLGKGDIVVVLYRPGDGNQHPCCDDLDDQEDDAEGDLFESLFRHSEENGPQEGRIGCLVSTGNGRLCDMRIESLIRETEHPLSFTDFAERDAMVAEVVDELRTFTDAEVRLNLREEMFELVGADGCYF